MATSLMIEACYYSSPGCKDNNEICGNTAKCFERLDEEHEIDLIYDIYTKYEAPEFPPGAE